MVGLEMLCGILITLMGVLGVVAIITLVVSKINAKEVNAMRNVYLGQMSNTDSSIQDAVKYLKLTNGICMDGEKNDE